MKIVEHKLEDAFSDGMQDVQLGRFILLSVPISQQLPRVTSLYFFFLSIDKWNTTALFVDSFHLVLNN